MKISIVGTGYVGLVTGVCLSEIGHHVTCIDVDEEKIAKLKAGIPTIYEPGLKELMLKNMNEGRLFFTANKTEGYRDADVIYIAVGTPQAVDGSADLTYVKTAAQDIANSIVKDTVVVIKSTVPVGTNHYIGEYIQNRLANGIKVKMVSNPEFLREGTAVKDMFHSDRIVIGAYDPQAAELVEKIYASMDTEIFKTDICSAEMIKYASNAFLATKISFINEIANICEGLGANIDDVAKGMGMDHRIGPHFLRAGIGYGGSCFPKDTSALLKIARSVNCAFNLLESVMETNYKQQLRLIEKAEERFASLEGLNIAMLGLAFKPDTDDVRESPAIPIGRRLVEKGAVVRAFDPLAIDNAKRVLPERIQFTTSIEEALMGADAAFIITDWKIIKEIDWEKMRTMMKSPVIFDGRNTYSLSDMRGLQIEYYSIGRPSVQSLK